MHVGMEGILQQGKENSGGAEEASLLAKNPELLNVTKYCIQGSDMLRSIADIWDLASGVVEDNGEQSYTAAFHQDTAVGSVFKEFVSGEPTSSSSSRRWRSTEEFTTTAELERAGRRVAKFISSYASKSNTAWLQLYAFLCAQTGCLITGRLPGAKAINALIQAETNPDNAPARLNRIINQPTEEKAHRWDDGP